MSNQRNAFIVTYKAWFEEHPRGILFLNDMGNIQKANRSALRLLGLDKDRVIGRSFDELDIHMVDLSGDMLDPRCVCDWVKDPPPHERKGVVFGIFLTKGHQLRWVNADCFPILQSVLKQEWRYVIEMEDISELKRQRNSLEEQVEMLQMVLDQTREGIVHTTIDGDILYANAAALSLLGCYPDTKNHSRESSILKVYDNSHQIMESVRNFSYSAPYFEIKVGLTTSTGSRSWVRARLRYVQDSASVYPDYVEHLWEAIQTEPYRDSRGRVIGIIGVSRDITSQRIAEKALHAVATCASVLIGEDEPLDHHLSCVTSILQSEMSVSRAYIYQNENNPIMGLCRTLRHEHCAKGIQPQIHNPRFQRLPYSKAASSFLKVLSQKEAFAANVSDLEGIGRRILEYQSIQSILILPIFCGETFWGFLGFDDCLSPRCWSEHEISLLKTMAMNIGMAIQRAKSVKEVMKAKAQAEQANQAKSLFLSKASHDLRLPLNGIVGFVDLFKDTLLTDTQKEYLEYIQFSSKMLMNVVGNILDYSIIEAGKMCLSEEKTDLRQLCRHVIGIVQFQAQNKGIEIVLEYDERIPSRVMLDPNRFQQVLLNLVGNGVKFTDQGTVTIRMVLNHLHTPEARANVRVEIEDTGMGIPGEAMEQINQPYTQAHAEKSRQFGGVGLGLAIISGILELMGTNLRVSSHLGKGSLFSFDVELQYLQKDETKTEATAPTDQAR